MKKSKFLDLEASSTSESYSSDNESYTVPARTNSRSTSSILNKYKHIAEKEKQQQQQQSSEEEELDSEPATKTVRRVNRTSLITQQAAVIVCYRSGSPKRLINEIVQKLRTEFTTQTITNSTTDNINININNINNDNIFGSQQNNVGVFSIYSPIHSNLVYVETNSLPLLRSLNRSYSVVNTNEKLDTLKVSQNNVKLFHVYKISKGNYKNSNCLVLSLKENLAVVKTLGIKTPGGYKQYKKHQQDKDILISNKSIFNEYVEIEVELSNLKENLSLSVEEFVPFEKYDRVIIREGQLKGNVGIVESVEFEKKDEFSGFFIALININTISNTNNTNTNKKHNIIKLECNKLQKKFFVGDNVKINNLYGIISTVTASDCSVLLQDQSIQTFPHSQLKLTTKTSTLQNSLLNSTQKKVTKMKTVLELRTRKKGLRTPKILYKTVIVSKGKFKSHKATVIGSVRDMLKLRIESLNEEILMSKNDVEFETKEMTENMEETPMNTFTNYDETPAYATNFNQTPNTFNTNFNNNNISLLGEYEEDKTPTYSNYSKTPTYTADSKTPTYNNYSKTPTYSNINNLGKTPVYNYSKTPVYSNNNNLSKTPDYTEDNKTPTYYNNNSNNNLSKTPVYNNYNEDTKTPTYNSYNNNNNNYNLVSKTPTTDLSTKTPTYHMFASKTPTTEPVGSKTPSYSLNSKTPIYSNLNKTPKYNVTPKYNTTPSYKLTTPSYKLSAGTPTYTNNITPTYTNTNIINKNITPTYNIINNKNKVTPTYFLDNKKTPTFGKNLSTVTPKFTLDRKTPTYNLNSNNKTPTYGDDSKKTPTYTLSKKTPNNYDKK